MSAFPQSLADSGGGIVDPYPSASRVFGATEKSIGESGVAPIDPRNGEGVLSSHNFIGALLAFASEVAIGELIAIEALMGTTVRAIIDGEGEAREASDVDFIGGKARGGAIGVVIGVFDVEKMDVPSFDELHGIAGVHLLIPVPCGLHNLPELYSCLPQRAKRRSAGQGAPHHRPSFFHLYLGCFKNVVHYLIHEQSIETRLSDLAWHHLSCGSYECVGEKHRFLGDCTPEFGMCELTGQELYQ